MKQLIIKIGDFNNNDINNLQILPRAEHNRLDTRRVKLIDMTCPMCHKDFKRSPRILRDKAKSKSPAFCSRSCSGKYSRLLQLKLIKKFKGVKPIKSEYFKLKKASFEELNIDFDFIDLLTME